MALCSINGCAGDAKQKGWCNKHLMRWRRHGDPLAGRPAMDIRSPETCSRWPSCGCCFDCEDDFPRSRWAAPIIIGLSLTAWAAIFGLIALLMSLSVY